MTQCGKELTFTQQLGYKCEYSRNEVAHAISHNLLMNIHLKHTSPIYVKLVNLHK